MALMAIQMRITAPKRDQKISQLPPNSAIGRRESLAQNVEFSFRTV